MSDPVSTADVSIDDGTITVQSGLFDTEDGIKLKVAGDSYPRIHLTPQGEVLQGDGTATPEVSSGGGTTKVPLPSDWTVNNDTTPSAVTGLAFAVENGNTYYFKVMCAVSGNSSADTRMGATYPAGSGVVLGYGLSRNASSQPNAPYHGTVDSSGDYVELGAITGETVVLFLEGTFICTADGTFQVISSQRIATVANHTLIAGHTYVEYSAVATV